MLREEIGILKVHFNGNRSLMLEFLENVRQSQSGKSAQASVLNLLMDIQQQFGTTIIFIAHDLSVVRLLSDYVTVMYLGKIMEMGPADEIYAPPYHPYTEALLSAVPIPNPKIEQKRIRFEGLIASALNPPSGCRFHTRCPGKRTLPKGGKICEAEVPPCREPKKEHRIFCHISLEKLSRVKPVISPAT